MPRTAFYEICASTAVWLAHGELGQAVVSEDVTQRAIAQTIHFCTDHGLGVLVQLYSLATQYENHQAVAYYGQIPERIFVLGEWHRPWVDYSLSDELVNSNRVPDFASMAQRRLPDWISQRLDFCLWAGIQRGMTVLGVGCGDGLFTFDGGLAEFVGPSGRLVATDPAASMLSRSRSQEGARPDDFLISAEQMGMPGRRPGSRNCMHAI